MKFTFIATVFCEALVLAATTAAGQTWTPTGAPARAWHSVALSADGTTMVAAANVFDNPPVFVSTNSGATWISNNVPGNGLPAVAATADGSKLMVLTTGFFYTSTNSGATWDHISNITNVNAGLLASSADGTRLLAAAADVTGRLYTSTNSGAAWTTNNQAVAQFTALASSADGTRLAAAANGVGIWTSPDSGLTWISNSIPTPPPVSAWLSVACSADGTRLAAGGYLNAIYTSTNSGLTWISNNVPHKIWQAIASSADGTKLAAVINSGVNGGIYTSTNSGQTWVSNKISSQLWQTVASSADGNRLAAAFSTSGSAIFSSQTTPSPRLDLAPTGNSLVLSWIVPSRDFELQQNSDLTTSNWLPLSNVPILNPTSLRNEVTLPVSGGNSFYRLATP